MESPIVSLITEKESRCTSGKPVDILYRSKNLSLREIMTERVRQMLPCALAVVTYASKDLRFNSIFQGMFSPGGLTVVTLKCGVFLQTFLESNVTGPVCTL